MAQAEQMADLVCDGRFEVKCPVRSIGRELLCRIEYDVGFGDRTFSVVKYACFRSSIKVIPAENKHIFGIRSNSDQIHTITRKTRPT